MFLPIWTLQLAKGVCIKSCTILSQILDILSSIRTVNTKHGYVEIVNAIFHEQFTELPSLMDKSTSTWSSTDKNLCDLDWYFQGHTGWYFMSQKYWPALNSTQTWLKTVQCMWTEGYYMSAMCSCLHYIHFIMDPVDLTHWGRDKMGIILQTTLFICKFSW